LNDLEKVEIVEDTSLEKQNVLNQIIAAGLNSLAGYTGVHATGPNKELLDAFAEQSFDRIIPCFDLLDSRIQLYVFMPHKDEFLRFMKQKQEG
jgi:hypothetical protein